MTKLNWESDRKNRKQKELGWDGWPPLAPATDPSNNPQVSIKSNPDSDARSTKGRRVSNSNMTETATGIAVSSTKRTPESCLKGIGHSLSLMRSKEWEKKSLEFRNRAVKSLNDAVNALRKVDPHFNDKPGVREALNIIEIHSA